MTSPFHHEKRRRFDKNDRARFFEAAGGFCANCRRKIRVGEEWDLDHEHALALGGTNADANIRVLCSICHVDKTGDDLAEASKSKRVYVKQHVPPRFRKSKAWGRR